MIVTFEHAVVVAMYRAEDAAMTGAPCICGQNHAPVTDCYFRSLFPEWVHVLDRALPGDDAEDDA